MKKKCMGYSDRATCFWMTKSQGSFATVFESRSIFMATSAKSSTWGIHYWSTTKTSWSCRSENLSVFGWNASSGTTGKCVELKNTKLSLANTVQYHVFFNAFSSIRSLRKIYFWLLNVSLNRDRIAIELKQKQYLLDVCSEFPSCLQRIWVSVCFNNSTCKCRFV